MRSRASTAALLGPDPKRWDPASAAPPADPPDGPGGWLDRYLESMRAWDEAEVRRRSLFYETLAKLQRARQRPRFATAANMIRTAQILGAGWKIWHPDADSFFSRTVKEYDAEIVKSILGS